MAASTGVETWEEVVKYLLAGSDVVMTTSALLRHSVEYMAALRDGLLAWMESRDYASLDECRASLSQQHVTDPAAFERANYIHVLQSYGKPNARVTSRYLTAEVEGYTRTHAAVPI